MTTFADHFSPLARGYAQYRPRYPEALFRWLADQCPRRTLAWDCATGTGQAATGLASYFDQVIATDGSAEQITQAESHAGVTYRVATAEQSGLEDACVDLVTVAQALHWFDLPRFYEEVRRVLRPDGVIAVWCYGNFGFDDPELDALMRRFYRDTVGPYWPAERVHVENGYASLDFPFPQIPAPPFAIEAQLTPETLAGYLRTWSATKRYREARGADPVAELLPQLEALWGAAATRTVRWPIHLKAGRV